VLRANVNGDDIPVGGLLDVDAAGVLSQVAGGQPLAPDVVQRAAEAGGALDDDVTVGGSWVKIQRAANPFRATFFSFWVVRKLATVNSEPSKSYQTGVTWGRPSGRTVARAATCGWLRKALTSAEMTAGIFTPGDGSARILSRGRRGRQTDT